MKAFLLNVVLLFLVVLASIPLLFLYLITLLGVGGGWAYAGPNGCHFQLNAIGLTMIIAPALVLCAVGWKLFRKILTANRLS